MAGPLVRAPVPGLFIRGATIVDARGERSGDVLVQDRRIVEVGDVRSATDEPVLAANGRYLTPGLIDCHIHLCHQAGPDPRVITGKTDGQIATEAAEAARRTLLAGVTTARDCGGRGFVETRLRDSIRAGAVEGPRLLTSGHPIVRRGGHMSYYARQIDGPEDARAAAREQIAGGVDWLKVAATGGVTTPNVDPRKAELTEEEIRAVVDEGRKAGRPAAAHAHGGDGIRNSLAGGVRSIEHGTYVDDDMIRFMVQQGVFLVPTLVATRAMIDAGTAKGVPEYAVKKAAEIDGERRKAFSACVARGVKIAMGTDAGTPFNPHGENARELALMVDAGMTPAQALEASTVTAAKLLGLEGEVGLVKERFAADLLLLSSNPLDDPIAFRRDVQAVVRSGRVVRG
jgi:imidazolonepropionase-like amidohydrolase